MKRQAQLIVSINVLTMHSLRSYAFANLKPDSDDAAASAAEGGGQRNEVLDFVYKSLDFGSGKERGVREYRIEESLGLEQSEKTKRKLKEDDDDEK